MADYRRFVSYMYHYEDGIKKNNVGFARVEAKNGQCKIIVNIKVPSLNNHTLKGYIFKRDDQKIIPIQLGNILIRNGTGDFRTITYVNNIMKTENSLDVMGGIIVYFNKDKFYATEWDDRPIILNNFEVDDIEERKEKNYIEVDFAEERREKNYAEDVYVEEKTDKNHFKNDDIEERTSKNSREEDCLSNEEEILQEVENKDLSSKSEMDMIQESPGDKQKVEYQATEQKSTKQQNTEQQSTQQQNTEQQNTEQQNDRQSVKNQENDRHQFRNITMENEKKDKLESQSFEKPSPAASRIFTRYTKMYPFEDNEIMECVRIEPQDIGALPMENWILGNNSFLLHGYYNYRHLIFARQRYNGSSQYIIGVPGVYQNREKFMAKLFGFDNFKTTNLSDHKTGEFGYWYTTVNV